MNKSELIDVLSAKANVTRKRMEDLINLIFDSMMDAMSRGDRIEIRGFGSFVVKNYGSDRGRKPRNGEAV